VSARKIAFVTGTRADFGKIKSLIATLLEDDEQFEVHIFATGMHMEPQYGFTVTEIEKCGFPNIYRFINQSAHGVMDRILAHTTLGFGDYVRVTRPDMIVVHGDRVEALAGAIVGALNNVPVAHIEGGEVSGTIDEHIRHAVSKMCHFHFVSNDDARRRLLQLGEEPDSVFVIGSPDLDIMSSPDLPALEETKAHYGIPFERYAILAFHPVTTSLHSLRHDVEEVIAAARESGRRFVAIYPNSDQGSELIFEAYEEHLDGQDWVRLFPSIRFEYFLTLLRHADFVLGNSSMGIREAPCYGVPTINVGDRQNGRSTNENILHVEPDRGAILSAIDRAGTLELEPVQEFGDGDSHLRFREVLRGDDIWRTSLQKYFRDVPLAGLDVVP
jgi:UDP-N-acetylglucosamine 2-epimerase (hydrolysing)